MAYKFKVTDAVDAKVKEVCARLNVVHDTSYRCQWEGVSLLSGDRGAVHQAAKQVAAALSRFKHVLALDDVK